MAGGATFLLFMVLVCLLSRRLPESRGRELGVNEGHQPTRKPLPVNPSRVLQLSWRPRLFLYQGFLTDKECDDLAALGRGRESAPHDLGVGGDESGLSLEGKAIIKEIDNRISAWSLLPEENGQPLRILHYKSKEDPSEELDYIGDKTKLSSSEPLMAVVIMYLSNASQGGQIRFPNSGARGGLWSECEKVRSEVRPKKGNAMILFTVQLNSVPDYSSHHSRCAVVEGEMWVATKLFYLRSIKSASPVEGCTDEDENCAFWAANGECQKNPVFMLGSDDYFGACRRSCNACYNSF